MLATYKTGSRQFQAGQSSILSNSSNLLFILRHGRIQGHAHRRFIGRTNVALDDLGRIQARFWQSQFKDIRFNTVYSSCLSRCRETAAIACPEIPAIPDPRLNEIHMGAWENQTFEQIRKNQPEEFERRGRAMATYRPARGESFDDLSNRIFSFFAGLHLKSYRNAGNTLVVTHAGVMRTFLARRLGIYPRHLFKIRLEYAQLVVVSPA